MSQSIKEVVYIGRFQDLTGQRFGKLTVIERGENDNQNRTRWKCECDCGNIHITQAASLKRGLCKSCGCLQKDKTSQTNKKYNTYDLSGEYGIGYTSKGEEFYFDLEDYDKIKDYCWFMGTDGYIETTINTTHSKLRIHRLIMNVTQPEIFVDHIYHDKKDNRKSQLRLVTNQQNLFNSSISKNNTSGYKGVYWHKKHNAWEALIQYNGKLIYLGLYNDINDAVKARKNAEIKYYGEYRLQENLTPITN